MHAIVSLIQESITIKIILSLTWTALSFFCGAYVGHKFNLSRDKRKEFNDATDIVYNKAIIERKLLTDDNPTRYETIQENDILMLVRIAPKRKKKRIWSAWKNHSVAKEKFIPKLTGRYSDQINAPYNLTPIIKTIDALIKEIDRQ
ncbi:hypothetical protein ACVXZ3_14360 [Providencia hangzhouensis]